ncbi:hypothetical protein N0V82_004980 [Gnomoniopsis sp. IMI 355080]|nr:hypothetical protein N0V82_004980 [Gnomoniopsis sp. IMI 355080]
MGQSMLSIRQSNDSSAKVTPNLLPCRIHHDGSVGSAGPYWTPSTDPDGKKISYFRGHELHGKTLKVPEGYRGVLVEMKDAPKPEAQRPEEPEVVDLEAEDELPLGALETQAQFDEMVIWGHESMAEAISDPYARGIEEWMKLTSQIHSYDGEKA